MDAYLCNPLLRAPELGLVLLAELWCNALGRLGGIGFMSDELDGRVDTYFIAELLPTSCHLRREVDLWNNRRVCPPPAFAIGRLCTICRNYLVNTLCGQFLEHRQSSICLCDLCGPLLGAWSQLFWHLPILLLASVQEAHSKSNLM